MDIVQIAIYNLRLRKEREISPAERKTINRDDLFFRFKEDICDFLDKNWRRLCIGKTRKLSLFPPSPAPRDVFNKRSLGTRYANME